MRNTFLIVVIFSFVLLTVSCKSTNHKEDQQTRRPNIIFIMADDLGLGAPFTEGVPNKQGFDFFYGYNCQRQARKHLQILTALAFYQHLPVRVLKKNTNTYNGSFLVIRGGRRFVRAIGKQFERIYSKEI